MKALRPLWFGLLVALVATPGTAAPLSSLSPVVLATSADRPVQQHKHKYVRRSKKVWVPPVTRQVLVGKDKKGKPVYKTEIVRPGYYKIVYYNACSCGATR
jgi:hypothetical protein